MPTKKDPTPGLYGRFVDGDDKTDENTHGICKGCRTARAHLYSGGLCAMCENDEPDDTTMRYYVLDEQVPQEATVVPSPQKTAAHNSWTAVDAAEEYFREFDGHESDWPLTMVLLGCGRETRWQVNMEYEPSFYAMPVKEDPDHE